MIWTTTSSLALIVDIMNDQVSSLQGKVITANLYWPFHQVESSCQSNSFQHKLDLHKFIAFVTSSCGLKQIILH